jgi:aminomethyltransferase
MPDVTTLRRTPLYEIHLGLKARMAPFGGFEMPIQYTGILREHEAARTGAALFDTCHMGEFHASGRTALADLERLISCRIGTLETGQCRYGLMCNEAGGVLDDLLVYRLGAEAFLLVVNAGTQDRDFEWMRARVSSATVLENRSSATAKIDIQGPESPRIMARLLERPPDGLRYYRFMTGRYGGVEVLVSRTGYTGEIGFELYTDAETARRFWRDAMALGAAPAGLGARDTLRLEVGLPLYGHELNEMRNAAESGFTKAIAADKDFVGSDRVLDPSARREMLSGMVFESRRAARNGDAIRDVDGREIGRVTSGSYAPSLGVAVALGYVWCAASVPGAPVRVRTDRGELNGKITALPFYPNGTARKPIRDFLRGSGT